MLIHVQVIIRANMEWMRIKYNYFKEKLRNKSTKDNREIKELYEYIASYQDSVLSAFVAKEASERGGILIYPGFDNDFVPFPLSGRAADIYAEIHKYKKHAICIFPEGGKDSLSSEEINYVAQKLKDNKSVQTLSIRNFSIGENGFKLFAEILQINKHLTMLTLENTVPTKQGVKALASALENNKTLTDLNIKRNVAVGKTIKSIATALEKNKTLERLDVGEVELTTEKAEYLKKLFTGKKRSNTTLIWINLDGNSISDSCKNLILNGIDKNKK